MVGAASNGDLGKQRELNLTEEVESRQRECEQRVEQLFLEQEELEHGLHEEWPSALSSEREKSITGREDDHAGFSEAEALLQQHPLASKEDADRVRQAFQEFERSIQERLEHLRENEPQPACDWSKSEREAFLAACEEAIAVTRERGKKACVDRIAPRFPNRSHQEVGAALDAFER